MLILCGVRLGTEIRDVHIWGGVVLCGGLGMLMGVGGAATREFWDRYWGCCMLRGPGGSSSKFSRN